MPFILSLCWLFLRTKGKIQLVSFYFLLASHFHFVLCILLCVCVCVCEWLSLSFSLSMCMLDIELSSILFSSRSLRLQLNGHALFLLFLFYWVIEWEDTGSIGDLRTFFGPIWLLCYFHHFLSLFSFSFSLTPFLQYTLHQLTWRVTKSQKAIWSFGLSLPLCVCEKKRERVHWEITQIHTWQVHSFLFHSLSSSSYSTKWVPTITSTEFSSSLTRYNSYSFFLFLNTIDTHIHINSFLYLSSM